MKKLQAKKCVLDSSCAVIEPPLHDSNLFKLDFSDSNNILLSFKLTTGDICVLHLNGVEKFSCDGLRKGNTVLDLAIYSGVNSPFEDLKDIIKTPKFNMEKHLVYLDNIKQKIQKQQLSIVVLNPSYGCKLVALVKDLEYSIISKGSDSIDN